MLGRKRLRKHPAHPDNYPGEGPISLPDAWEQLAPTEFSLWVRLCAEPPEALSEGRRALALRLGYSYRQFNALIRQLTRNAFVSVTESDRPGNVTAILIERRAMVTGRTSFARLSK